MAKAKTSTFVLPGPDDLNEPPENLLSYCIFLFGEKGIGKTSLCANFPNAIVGMLEPRRKNLRIRMVDLTPGWERVEEFVEAAIKDPTVSTICLDTADRLYDSAMDYICQSKGVAHPSKMNDYGATWREIKDLFENTLGKIQNSGKGLVLTSHAKWKETELRNGEKMQILCPTLSDSPWTIVKAVADYAFYYGYYNNKRALFLRGHEDLWCACGSEDRFLDPNGNPLKTVLLGENPRLAFETFDRAFGNQVWDVSSEEGSSPSEESDPPASKSFPRKKVKAQQPS